MANRRNRGLRRLLRAIEYSWRGLRSAFFHEEAFRQEVALFVILVPLALWLGNNQLERIVLIAPVFLLLIIELLNSAIEATVDRFGEERHELSGRAKDMGSAAVFLTIIVTALIWLLVLV